MTGGPPGPRRHRGHRPRSGGRSHPRRHPPSLARRLAVAVAGLAVALPGLAVALAVAAPARADDGLTVAVAAVAPGQVRLVADVPGSLGPTPQVTVARDGWVLPSTVSPDPSGAPQTVVIVLDTGRAMAGTPLRQARDAVLGFADAVPAGTAVGLVSAGGQAAVAVPPTGDRAALRTGLAGLRASGGTAVYQGLDVAAGLAKPGQRLRLLVVAGGRDNADGRDEVVRRLRAAGHRLDLVTTTGGTSGLAEARELAAASGGTVQQAATADEMTAALRAAAGGVPSRVRITATVPDQLAGAAATLTVTVARGTARATAQVPVRFAAPPSASGAADTGEALPGVPVPNPGLLGIMIFGLILAAVLLAAYGVGGSTRDRRLRQVERFRLTGQGGEVGTAAVPARVDFAAAARGGEQPQTGGGRGGDPAQRARPAAGDPAAQRLVLPLASAAVGAILLGLLGGLAGVLLGALLGGLLTVLVRRLGVTRRRRAFADQLPDALQLIVGSLRSGFSLSQAIDAVVKDSPPGPLAEELGRALTEVRLGSNLDDALERAAGRAENDDLAWAVMAIRIQRETGGNLAEVLETTVETLRERDRLRRHVRALSAEGRLSAYVLIGLPIVMAAFMYVIRRDYLAPLWTTRVGLMMLVAAAALMVVGTVWMARWMRVEV